MSLDPVSAIADAVRTIADKVLPDANAKLAATAKINEMVVGGELAAVAGQLQINVEEAKSQSVFVAGWRPFIGWICGIGIGYQFLAQPLLAWLSLNTHWQVPPTLDVSTLWTIAGGMLGLGAMRTAEKVMGVKSPEVGH